MKRARPPVRSLVAVAAAAAALWCAAADRARAAPAPGDPLPSIDLSPVRQISYQFPDRGPAAALAPGTLTGDLRTSYFAMVSQQSRLDSSILIDLEGARFDLQPSYALTDRWTIGADLPLIVYYGGVLDSVVDAVDRAVGTPSPQRKQLGHNVYHFELTHAGDAPFAPAPANFGLGDLALELRWRALEQASGGVAPDLSLTAVVEPPTGDPGLAHGNGAVDFGFDAELGKTLGDFRLSATAGLVVPGDPTRLPGISADPAFSGLLAGAYAVTAAWNLIAQVDYRPSPYRGSGVDAISAASSELAVGFRWSPAEPPVTLEAAFVEGLVNGASPDFSALISLSYRLPSGLSPAPP